MYVSQNQLVELFREHQQMKDDIKQLKNMIAIFLAKPKDNISDSPVILSTPSSTPAEPIMSSDPAVSKNGFLW